MAAKKAKNEKILANGNRTAFVLSLVILVLVAGIYLMPGGGVTGYAAFHVCSVGCDFTTIQPAIDAALPGDVIYVCSRAGVDPWYTENVNVTKSLTLVANASCTYGPVWINASNVARPTVNISANDVNMTGFLIKAWRGQTGFGENSRGINIDNARNVTVERTDINTGYYNVYLKSTINVTLADMLVDSSYDISIYLRNATNTSIDRARITNPRSYIIGVSPTAGDPASKNTYIRDGVFENTTESIYVGSNGVNNRTEVINCTIKTTNTDAAGATVFIDFNSGYFNRIVNNTFNATGAGGARTGFYLGNLVNATLSDNRIINVTNTAVDLAGTFANSTIANNTFSKTVASTAGYDYFSLDGTGSYNLIENNTFRNVNDSGGVSIINVGGGFANSKIRLNKIYDSTSENGIKIYGSNNLVENNTIRGVFDYSIYSRGDYNDVRSNTIEVRKTSTGCEGVHDDGYNSNNYSYNTIYSDSTPSAMSACYGIFSYGGSGSNIMFNNVRNVGTGIHFGGWELTSISNNTVNSTMTGIYVNAVGVNVTNNSIENAQTHAIRVSSVAVGVNVTGNTICKSNLGYYNDTAGVLVEDNNFCVLPSSPTNGATVASLTDFRFNASNPVYWQGTTGGRRNTTCQLYIDNIFVGRNSSVHNNNASLIAYSTLPAAGTHYWYVYCNDSAGTNYGNSSVMSFIVQSSQADNGGICSDDSGCVSGHCVHGICRADATHCGDSYCDSGETCTSCSGDCGQCGYTPPPGCKEICPEATLWTDCLNVTAGLQGVKTRTLHRCTALTNWLCEQYEEVDDCAVVCDCPPPDVWYDCYHGSQERKNFRCDATTDWKCEEYQERTPCAESCGAKPAEVLSPCIDGGQSATLFYCNETTHMIWWNYTEPRGCVSVLPAAEIPQMLAKAFFKPETRQDWMLLILMLIVIIAAVSYTVYRYRKMQKQKAERHAMHMKGPGMKLPENKHPKGSSAHK